MVKRAAGGNSVDDVVLSLCQVDLRRFVPVAFDVYVQVVDL